MRFRSLLLVSCFLASCRTAGNSPTPAPDAFAPPTGEKARAFTTRFLAIASKAHPDLHAAAAGDLTVSVPGGGEMNLGNLWGECSRATSSCDEAMGRYADALAAANAPPQPARREQLRLSLYPSSAIPPEIVARPWLGGLAEVVVVDTTGSFALLTSDRAKSLAMPVSEIFAAADANLRHATDAPLEWKPFDEETAPGLRIAQSGDGYLAAHVLAADRFQLLAKKTKGDLLVAIPTRDVLIAGGLGNKNGALGIRYLAQQMFQHEPHPISPVVLRWTPKGFEVFDENVKPVTAADVQR